MALSSSEIIQVPVSHRDELVHRIDRVLVQADDHEFWQTPGSDILNFLAEFVASDALMIKGFVPRDGTQFGFDDEGFFFQEDMDKRYFGLPRTECSAELRQMRLEPAPQFSEYDERMVQSIKAVEAIQQQVLTAAFRKADLDSSGYLNRQEIERYLRKAVMTLKAEDAAAILEKADLDKDGKISYTEFVAWLMESSRCPCRTKVRTGLVRAPDAIRALLRIFDADENGLISRQELHSVFKKACPHTSPQELERIISIVDANHDNNISYDEFVDFLFGKKGQQVKVKVGA